MTCLDTSEVFATGQWLINREIDIVDDALMGLVKSNTNLAILDFGKVVIRKDHLSCDKVKILSGGASGHEPAYAGFVGQGMLTAAVQGDIYSSPSADSILRTIKELSRRHVHGILLIVNNNESDRLNFGLAMEKANNIQNVQVKMVLVTDECNNKCERRGLAGTILMQKIAGAMSEMGFFLDEIHAYCESILCNISSVLVSFTMPETPYIKIQSTARFLKQKQIEFGAGYHGEPGFLKMPLKTAYDTVKTILDHIFDEKSSIPLALNETTPILIIVNNLGTTSKLEEQIFLQEVITQVQKKNIPIVKAYCGMFLTSLKMSGFSVTVMKLTDLSVIEYLNYPCSVACWTPLPDVGTTMLDPEKCEPLCTTFTKEELRPLQLRGPVLDSEMVKNCNIAIKFACDALVSCERQLNIIDSQSGDADTGTNIKKAAMQISEKLSNARMNRPFMFLKEISEILEINNSGLLGCIYSIIFQAAASSFADLPETYVVDAHLWLQSLKSACDAVARYGKVKVGDKTMYDPLHIYAKVLENSLASGVETIEALGLATSEAEHTAAKTKIFPNRHPDPGAHAVGIMLRAVYEGIKLSCDIEL